MRDILPEHAPVFRKMMDRTQVNILSHKEIALIASHCTKPEFIECYGDYLRNTFKGSIMNQSSMDMALNDCSELFMPEVQVETRRKGKK